jgi:hypothetical protein
VHTIFLYTLSHLTPFHFHILENVSIGNFITSSFSYYCFILSLPTTFCLQIPPINDFVYDLDFQARFYRDVSFLFHAASVGVAGLVAGGSFYEELSQGWEVGAWHFMGFLAD